MRSRHGVSVRNGSSHAVMYWPVVSQSDRCDVCGDTVTWTNGGIGGGGLGGHHGERCGQLETLGYLVCQVRS